MVEEKIPSSVLRHIPVLADFLLEKVCFPPNAILVDATVGYGGHSLLLGARLGPEGMIIGLDVDPQCIETARSRLEGLPCRIILERENFDQLKDVLVQQKIDTVDFILADLGFCSGQIEDPRRGLSFQQPMPLDMRLDDRLEKTAADWIHRTDEKKLADLLYQYGEERASRRIARFIAEQRRHRPIQTTTELASLVCRALRQPDHRPGRKIHPATRTFQALRIAVNDELGCLERLLKAAPDLLRPDGRIAVISFHSLEDRIVKHDFKRNQAAGIYELVTPRPITANADERKANPRSRSARLRIAQRKTDGTSARSARNDRGR
ncbi:MAG: 16S rRNA (cytosine(1402)-N(4))-methyltransferase RsmH [Sedimentisphaerales bacterium]|nr:16S rRNA (cytosine(1402)-N(4))-methyltransferase RsmH [Sedimentisphaerales bacterium]